MKTQLQDVEHNLFFRGAFESIVIFDLDGVVADFSGASVDHFGPADISHYSLEARWPDKKREVQDFVTNPLTYLFLRPIPGVREAINRIRKAGFTPIAVTARPATRGMWLATWLWLKLHRINLEGPYLVPFSEKVQRLTTHVRPWAIIDDSPNHLRDFALYHKSLTVFCLSQAWNYTAIFDVNVHPIFGWERFSVLELIEGDLSW